MQQIRIAIIDDERLIREGLKIILSTHKDIAVAALGKNGLEAVEICKAQDIDLVLMDIRMPDCDGVEGTKLVKTHCPNTQVLILTTFKDVSYIQEALKNGASGYLLKDSSSHLIYAGIKATLSGNIVIHPDIADNILDLEPSRISPTDFEQEYGLTERECQLIALIAQGLSNKEISTKLYLSEGTVKNYISTILSKLHLRDRTQIVIFAYQNGLAD